MNIPVGIVGVTGYAGQELLKILRRHPHVSISYLGSKRLKKPEPFQGLTLLPFDASQAARRCRVLFLAMPHGEAMKLAPSLLKNGDLKIIDISGDFRLKSASLFKSAYGMPHASSSLLSKAVYGLPELNRAKIPGCRLVANPGCYPTSALLALAPLAEKGLLPSEGVIVNSVSGTSGAGRSAKTELLFCEINEDFRAYKVDKHQHTPEIEQELGRLAKKKLSLTFVPHLGPFDRGILSTIYVPLTRKISEAALRGLYETKYRKEPFVKLLPKGTWPAVKPVNGTNRCDLGVHLDPSGKRAVILSAIDNLVKGAAGQAVQNMNLLFGWNEQTALTPSGR